MVKNQLTALLANKPEYSTMKLCRRSVGAQSRLMQHFFTVLGLNHVALIFTPSSAQFCDHYAQPIFIVLNNFNTVALIFEKCGNILAGAGVRELYVQAIANTNSLDSHLEFNEGNWAAIRC